MVEIRQLSIGTKGVCIPVDIPTLKSVEVQNGGFRSEKDATLEAARSLLFLELGECIAVVMAHVCLAVTKSREL